MLIFMVNLYTIFFEIQTSVLKGRLNLIRDILNMFIDVHVAFLLAALSVLFGITYTLGTFLDHQTKKLLERKRSEESAATNAAIKA
ncbi:hypothetical protein A3715_17680 [Oleiphilus sp. HI0009]|nr:hypothetical protein A3715_17680 [Oleiphilus sp. HI0009]KZY62761.1 hypothetical protein A3738_12515 [Oleiphilus sp. HI0066]KZY70548.1 hypothetical protein A3739_17785 [Oleiphilus sp. HI0067]KZY71599.1 hypothetical protein A3739_04195 [Oleiphilus sp. HI0067]